MVYTPVQEATNVEQPTGTPELTTLDSIEQCIAGVREREMRHSSNTQASSAELVSERYAVHAIPTDETKGWQLSQCQLINTGSFELTI